MKQLLLITAISCVCCTQGFAGSCCKPSPTGPTPTNKDQTTDQKSKTAAETNSIQAILVANDASAQMTPNHSLDQVPGQSPTQTPAKKAPNPSQIKDLDDNQDLHQDDSTPKMPKLLLAGGTAPSNTDASPEVPPTNRDLDMPESEKPVAPQLLA